MAPQAKDDRFIFKSSLQIINVVGITCFSVLGIGYCIYNFYENPAVMSILIAILLGILFLSGRDVLELDRSGIQIGTENIYFKKLSRIKNFYFTDIDEINIKIQLTKSLFLSDELPGGRRGSAPSYNVFTFKFKDGKERKIITKVYKEAILKIVEIIKRNSSVQVVLDDYTTVDPKSNW